MTGLDNDQITITERDIVAGQLTRADLPRNLEHIYLPAADISLDKTGAEVDPKGITTLLGIPTDETGQVVIPNMPTIMTVDRLVCKDASHGWTELPNTTAVFGHGNWNTQTERWEMAGGRGVKDIVEAWERYADKNGLPRVGFVIACDTQASSTYEPPLMDKLQALLSKTKREEIDRKKMRTEVVMPTFTQDSVVESRGKVVWLANAPSRVENGRSTVVVYIADGEFNGLDSAIQAKEIGF